ncbi:MAG TPA: glycosyltransferase family 4 protein, partial [Candidatus Ozemobacteraceae bacterium]
MNILQLVNALTWGGAQILVADLARAARSAGHTVVIAAFRDGPVGSQLRHEDFDVRILGEEAFDLVAAWRLLRLWRDFRPDVIHSHLSRATFWARFLRHRAPQTALVTTIHGFESGSFHVVEQRMASLSDHLIFPSAFLESWYETQIRRLPPGRASVLYPGVEISPPEATQPASADREPRIGTLSRLHRVKGIDILLEACARLKGYHPFRIVIGGEGKEHDRLAGLANRLGIANQLEWAGPIASPKAFLGTIDIFAAPSREEAFGITICEAMERSLPVVASRVGGIPEILRDGTDGFLVTPECPEELAAALHRLLGDAGLRQTMGAAGSARVRTGFRRDACIEKHFDIYHSLLSTTRPAARRL